jgi:hypothetical protein
METHFFCSLQYLLPEIYFLVGVILLKKEKNTLVSNNKREEYRMDKKNQKANPKKEVAGSFYHPSYYQETDDLSAGLATTHEQASDTYKEGEIGAVIDNINGEDIPIPQKGYDK